MKPILACLLLLAPVARGQIFADVSTTMGDFTIELDHVNSPLTVANLIRLAEGSTPWIHPDTGRVHFNTPFYNGIIFHRVIAGFMNQTGSPRGDGSDGPGYNFMDEVNNGKSHFQYSVSMANSGPNTNGSQFFITAAVTSWLDGKHTVFGTITSGSAVIDAINSTPTTGSVPETPVVINSITIRREGGVVFDEHAQGLPTVTAPATAVQHDGTATTILFNQPARSQAYCYHSSDLTNWSPFQRFLHSDASPSNSLDLTAETTGQAQHFFATSVINYPTDAIFPDAMANRTLTATLIGDGRDGSGNNYSGTPFGIVTFQFDGAGGGTYLYGSGGGTITSYEYSDGDLYGGTLLVFTTGLIPLRFRLGMDLFDNTTIQGRHTGTMYFASGDPIPDGPLPCRGTFTLTR